MKMPSPKSSSSKEAMNDPEAPVDGGNVYPCPPFASPTPRKVGKPKTQILEWMLVLFCLSTIGLTLMTYFSHVEVKLCQWDLANANVTLETRTTEIQQMESDMSKLTILARGQLTEINGIKSELMKLSEEKDAEIHRLHGKLVDLGKEVEALKSELTSGKDSFILQEIERKRLENENIVLSGKFDEIENELKSQVIVCDKRQNELVLLKNQNVQTENELSKFKTLFFGNDDWNSELHLAAKRGDFNSVEKLVQNGADLNVRNRKLETPLHVASYNIHGVHDASLHIINYLIEMGTDVFAKDHDNNTFLSRLLFGHNNIRPNDFRKLVLALNSQNHLKIFETPIGGEGSTSTIFQWTVNEFEIDEDTLALLHKNGVNFNAVDNLGDSVLFYAVLRNRSISMLSNLVKFGADWTHNNSKNQSLLTEAATRCNLDAIRLFLQLGLDVNQVDEDGNTPLSLALCVGEGNVLETVRLLISGGANVKIKNKDGLTPMVWARWRDDLPDKQVIIQLLKASKA